MCLEDINRDDVHNLKENKKYFSQKQKEVEFVDEITYSLTDTAFISKKEPKLEQKDRNIVQKIQLNIPDHITRTLDAITSQLQIINK